MSQKILRAGIVGYGFMGKMHSHAYRSLGFYYEPPPANIELVGVATQSQESCDRAVVEGGFAFGTTDYRELCARDDIDIINCCTPNCNHHEVLLCALEHGKHVYMDKPLSRTLDEAKAMKQAAEAHPECITQMAFQYRYVPAMLRAKELMDDGALGEIFSARVCYLHAGYIDPNRPYTWRLDTEKSGEGGALFDLGSHVVDLTRYLLGEFDSVYHLGETMIKERPLAWDPTRKKSVNVDDISMMMFRLSGGGIGTIESSRLATGVQDELRMEVHGSKGAIQFNLMQPNFLRYYDATAKGGDFGGERGFQEIECVGRYPSPAKLPGPKNTIGWERFHIHSIYNFVTNIINGDSSQPDIADGTKTQAILDAALQSSKTEKWCVVPSI